MKIFGYQQASSSMLQQQQKNQKPQQRRKHIGRADSTDDSHTEITQSSDGSDDLSAFFVSDIGYSLCSFGNHNDPTDTRRRRGCQRTEGQREEAPCVAGLENQKAQRSTNSRSESAPLSITKVSLDETPKAPARSKSTKQPKQERRIRSFPGSYEHVDMKELWANPMGPEAAIAKDVRREAQRQYLRWQQWYSIQSYQRQRTLQRQKQQQEQAEVLEEELASPDQQTLSASPQEEAPLVIESPVVSPSIFSSRSSSASHITSCEDQKKLSSYQDAGIAFCRLQQSHHEENVRNALSAPRRPLHHHKKSTRNNKTTFNYKQTICNETNLSPGQVDVDSLLQKYKKVVDDLSCSSSSSSSSDEEDSSDDDSDSDSSDGDSDSSDSDSDDDDEVLLQQRRRRKKAVTNRGGSKIHRPFHIYTITEV